MKTRPGTVFATFIAATTVSSFFIAAAAEPQSFRVVSEESEFLVHVGRAGLFKVLGHDHRIRVGNFTGTIRWDTDAPERSEFTLEVDAASLYVADDELSDGDRNDVQANMETEALGLPAHPTISFVSARVDVAGQNAGEHLLKVAGELTLRGVRGPLEIPLALSRVDGRLIARGGFELESKDWNVPQISALGGSVKTNTDLKLEFEIVAEPEN